MYENNFYEILKKYALDNKNYKNWRKVHAQTFGDIFEDAFSQSEEASVCLTAALINISQKNFDYAMPKLDMLEKICGNEFDETAVNYFKGLNYEFLGNESKMTEYYENIKSASVIPKFPLVFHPYYRTAKFAQRDSECSKSYYYYCKALEFYDGATPNPHITSIISHIVYDIATLCLYMHEYEKCEYYLKVSTQYDSSVNQQRDYVYAILLATQGKKDECDGILQTLSPFLSANGKSTTDAIFNGIDPHYCVTPQDRTQFADFWTSFEKDEAEIKDLISNNSFDEAEKNISQKLTRTLGFMKRSLACRIEVKSENIVVKCKNYRVKSLIAEHHALFAMKPENLSDWNFISTEEFEAF